MNTRKYQDLINDFKLISKEIKMKQAIVTFTICHKMLYPMNEI